MTNTGFERALSWAVEHQRRLTAGKPPNNTTGVWKIFVYILCGITVVLLLMWLMVKFFGKRQENNDDVVDTNVINMEILDMINDDRNSFPPLGPDE